MREGDDMEDSIRNIIESLEWCFKDAEVHNFDLESEVCLNMTFKEYSKEIRENDAKMINLINEFMTETDNEILGNILNEIKELSQHIAKLKEMGNRMKY